MYHIDKFRDYKGTFLRISITIPARSCHGDKEVISLKKAVLYGNYTNYLYHPLKGVDDEIKSIFEKDLDINATEDLNVFSPETLKETELVILTRTTLIPM